MKESLKHQESGNRILAILESLKSDNLTAQTEAVKEDVNKNLYISKLIEELETHLKENYSNLRKNQKRTLNRLVLFLKAGKLDGLIKQPTGAGKTRIIAETARAFSEPSLVLVPRTALVSQTYTEMVGNEAEDIDGIGFDKTEVFKIDEQAKTSAFQVRRFLEETKKSTKPVSLIITYQSLVSLEKSDRDLYEELMEYVQIIHTDEAHRSLGEKTQEALNLSEDIKDEEELTEEEQKDEDSALKLIKKNKKLFLRYTATPKLSQKEVLDVFDTEIIDWLKIQELVEDGVLILPQHKKVGTFVANIDKNELTKSEYVSNSFLQSLSENDRFVEEGTGLSLNEVHLRDYKEIKELNDGYAPGVAYCATVKEAEERMRYFQAHGIRCKRCTSNVAGVNPTDNVSDVEAKKMLNQDEVDLIFTVTKVAEGWDVPTLRVALWFTPSKSPARVIQANGRIMRSLRANSPHPAKSSENTWILEPTFMVRYSKATERKIKEKEVNELKKEKDDNSITTNEGQSDENKQNKNKYESQSFWQMLVDNDEFEAGFLKKLNPHAEIQYPFDFNNDDHLRLLIGDVNFLIKDGKGVNLVGVDFELKEKGWKFNASQISYALLGDWNANVENTEKIANILWSKEAKELLPSEKFDINNLDHLRQIIGRPENLLRDNGKVRSLQTLSFESKEKKWKVSGMQIGLSYYDKCFATVKDGENLLKMLWPKKAKELFPSEKFDINNLDRLRQIIGRPENLKNDEKPINLFKESFKSENNKWELLGQTLVRNFLEKYDENIFKKPYTFHLAKILWPQNNIFFDIQNNDHLREIIGCKENLFEYEGSLKKLYFEIPEKNWRVSTDQIARNIFNATRIAKAHMTQLAKMLWPEESEALLGKTK